MFRNWSTIHHRRFVDAFRVGEVARAKSARWSDAFKGAQVVVHLAADTSPAAPWGSILPNNIAATFNVLQAAGDHGVRRVVFASSNWAVRALERKLAPDCYRMDGPKIDSGTAPFPLRAYGLSKGFGELAGRMFVDEGHLKSFIAVRIGFFSLKPPKDESLSTRWIGAEDIRTLFRRCVEAQFEGFHIVYGVSAQKAVPYDLDTRENCFPGFRSKFSIMDRSTTLLQKCQAWLSRSGAVVFSPRFLAFYRLQKDPSILLRSIPSRISL